MEEMTMWAVVAARMGSSRMAGKSMAVLAGRPSLAHVVARLRRSRHLDGIVVATPDGAENDPIRACACAEDVPCFSGSEDDVLGRTLGAARSVGADVIVQVTGDCPLADPRIVDRVIEAYWHARPDYASNCLLRSYPDGMDVEVFATAVLAEADRATTDPADREHVSLYTYGHPERYRLLNVPAPAEHTWPDLRLTLDTPEDYRVIGAIYDALHPGNPAFGLPETLAWLRAHPEVLTAHFRRSLAQTVPSEARGTAC
jgi:spore coat polysaccharide biosynthesis protein SpsF